MTSPRTKPSPIEATRDSSAVALSAAAPAPALGPPPEELIRQRAYELHLERGEAQSDALENWLRAEVELRETHVGT